MTQLAQVPFSDVSRSDFRFRRVSGAGSVTAAIQLQQRMTVSGALNESPVPKLAAVAVQPACVHHDRSVPSDGHPSSPAWTVT